MKFFENENNQMQTNPAEYGKKSKNGVRNEKWKKEEKDDKRRHKNEEDHNKNAK